MDTNEPRIISPSFVLGKRREALDCAGTLRARDLTRNACLLGRQVLSFERLNTHSICQPNGSPDRCPWSHTPKLPVDNVTAATWLESRLSVLVVEVLWADH